MEQYFEEVKQCRKFLPHHRVEPAHRHMEEIADFMKTKGISSDFYGTGAFINAFESQIAQLLGYESGLFGPSGTMLQGIACRIYSERKGSKTLALHPSSHLLSDEHFGIQHLHGLNWIYMGQANRVLSKDDVLSTPAHIAATVLELPMRRLAFQSIPWDDLSQIASNKTCPIHLDGARLWEVQPWYGKSYQDICQAFDSTYVSFYKGMGALPGSMLCGSSDFIEEAKIWLRRCGGNLFQQTTAVVSASLQVEKRLTKFKDYHNKAKDIAEALISSGIAVNPESVQSNAFVITLPISAQKANERLSLLRRQEKIHLCPPFQDNLLGGTASAELAIGDCALDWGTDRVLDLFCRLSEG
ncbi:MAG: hypothetical protein HRU19_00865 [Pseudobacteriovorax sp.]|nr:hypothetical protein [Pseudobacteriovorax sp.]